MAQIFDNEVALSNLETFVSINGAKHYNLDKNKEKIKLIKLNQSLILLEDLIINNEKIKIFNPDFSIFWKVQTL